MYCCEKAKRFLALFLVLCMMVCAMALPASAYSYNFSFPAQQANSMRSTSLYTRGTSTAYVDPDVTTISTIYFLSPTRVSSTQATALVYKTSGTRSNFSWLSGYERVIRIVYLAVPTGTWGPTQPTVPTVLGICKELAFQHCPMIASKLS